MGAVKNHFHDEICGISDACRQADAEMIPTQQAAREYLAREVGRPRDVADILEGKWDNTPAYRKIYGAIWLQKADNQ